MIEFVREQALVHYDTFGIEIFLKFFKHWIKPAAI